MLLSIYPKDLKTYVHTKTCTWRFLKNLFMISNFGSNKDALQWMHEYINCDAPRQWNDFSAKECELSIHKKAWRKL